jgi:hypothetical protein
MKDCRDCHFACIDLEQWRYSGHSFTIALSQRHRGYGNQQLGSGDWPGVVGQLQSSEKVANDGACIGIETTLICAKPMARLLCCFLLLAMDFAVTSLLAQSAQDAILARPGQFHQLTEPPCSYCSTQQRKGLVRVDDPVIAWVRGAHNGGAIPLRHFLAAPRVINDTYGLFFYDPDGGYVSAFKKDSLTSF